MAVVRIFFKPYAVLYIQSTVRNPHSTVQFYTDRKRYYGYVKFAVTCTVDDWNPWSVHYDN